jgi:hypothetical protein
VQEKVNFSSWFAITDIVTIAAISFVSMSAFAFAAPVTHQDQGHI